MVITRVHPAFRRLALALAAAQLLAYALVPVLEARTERNPGPVHIERAHTKSCIPIHAPDSCLACQLLTTQASTPTINRGPLRSEESRSAEGTIAALVAPRPPPPVLLPRAPPTALA